VAHGPGEWVDFLSFEALAGRMREARVVVCHAGVGSMMLARRCGRRPVVVPRRLHLNEAVDDHQLPLARRLDAAGAVTLVEDADRLSEVVAGADAVPAARLEVGLPGAEALCSDLRDVLAGLGAGLPSAA
jgi:UDP-N-acetylglucosamine transferase subunit ALG13